MSLLLSETTTEVLKSREKLSRISGREGQSTSYRLFEARWCQGCPFHEKITIIILSLSSASRLAVEFKPSTPCRPSVFQPFSLPLKSVRLQSELRTDASSFKIASRDIIIRSWAHLILRHDWIHTQVGHGLRVMFVEILDYYYAGYTTDLCLQVLSDHWMRRRE